MSLVNMQHGLHRRHKLTLTGSARLFRCSGCKEKGLSRCYTCPKGCDFRLHEECAVPDQSAYRVDLMESCGKLKFCRKPPKPHENCCVACGKDIQGFVYQCSAHNEPHYIHPYCLKLSDSKIHREGHVSVDLLISKKPPTECHICKRKKVSPKINGWCYVSRRGEYCYHVACLMDWYIKKWKQDHLGRGDKTNIDSSALNIGDPSLGAILRPRRGNGPSSSKFKKFCKVAVKAAVKLSKIVVSAWL